MVTRWNGARRRSLDVRPALLAQALLLHDGGQSPGDTAGTGTCMLQPTLRHLSIRSRDPCCPPALLLWGAALARPRRRGKSSGGWHLSILSVHFPAGEAAGARLSRN